MGQLSGREAGFRLCQGLMTGVFIMTAPSLAHAQDFSGRNLPIVNPQPDINGVDVASGSLSVVSPFAFNAPGAGHLSAISVFNGRKLTTTLNAYLDDQTLTMPLTGDSNERQIRVHFGGEDHLFLCSAVGPCELIDKNDGSTLLRDTLTGYRYIAKDGMIMSFFPMITTGTYPTCQSIDVEDGCNAAEYQGYSYASSIKYPNGEKIDFADLPEIRGNSIISTATSNLGYKIEVASPCTNCHSSENYIGLHWLSYRGQPTDVTYRLFKGQAEISRLTVHSDFLNLLGSTGIRAGLIAAEKNTSITNIAGREFKIRFQARVIASCGTVVDANGSVPGNINSGTAAGSLDATNFVPIEITSPGGLITYITYKGILAFTPMQTNIPVETVSRGTEQWHYNHSSISNVIGSTSSLTVTNPAGGTYRSDSVARVVPWPTSWGRDETNWCGAAKFADDVMHSVDPNGFQTSFSYASAGLVSEATLPARNMVVSKYDARGNVVKREILSSSASDPDRLTLFEADYDLTCSNFVTCNQPNWTKDGNGAQTDYEYDPAHGGITRVISPADEQGQRSERRRSYEPFDTGNGIIYRLKTMSNCQLVANCWGTGDEVVTSFAYGAEPNLPNTKTIAFDGKSSRWQMAYDNSGRITMEVSPSNVKTFTFFDDAGRLRGSIQEVAAGSSFFERMAVRYTYNNDDKITETSFGTIASSSSATLENIAVERTILTVYDVNGRKQSDRMTLPSGVIVNLKQYTYDPVGRLECTMVRMNPSVYTSLLTSAAACTPDARGSGENDFGPDRITKNVYDAAGQLIQVREGVGTPIEQAYATYSYTANGKRELVIDANGSRAKLGYDGFDRLTRWTFPSASLPSAFDGVTPVRALETAGALNGADYEAYTYDANGNRETFQKRDGRTLAYGYDALNRMTSKIVPEDCSPIQVGGCPDATATRDVFYGYDLRGLQTYARFDGHQGDGVTNSYDGLGHLVSSTTAMADTSRKVSAAYDAVGNQTQLTTPGGIWTYTYDELNRLVGLYEGVSTASAMSAWKYNMQGLPKSVVERSGSGVSWTYDGADRLLGQSDTFVGGTGSVTATLEYNPANQIITRGRSNPAYAYSDQYAVSRSYVVNGLSQYSRSGANDLKYDANGNLIKEIRSDGTDVDYVYDAENRLIKRDDVSLSYDPLGRLFEVSTSPGNSTQFLYDRDQLVAEYDGSGTLTNAYVHGPGVDDPLLWYPSGSAVRWYHRDQQGSIVATADGASGTLAGINTYDEYGIRGSGNAGRFQYTGQIWLPELGIYHYKARAYSPMLGRFIQTDPIGYDDQVNLYAYVANDPVNGRDPTGMYECTGNSRCATFNKAQDIAKDKVGSAITTLTSIERKQRSGERLASSEKNSVKTLAKYLGSSSSSNLGKVIATAKGTLDALNSKIPVRFAAQDGNNASNERFRSITIRPSFFNRTYADGARIIAHEGFHQATGFNDFGKSLYTLDGRQNALDRAYDYRENQSRLMENPENFVYGIGF